MNLIVRLQCSKRENITPWIMCITTLAFASLVMEKAIDNSRFTSKEHLNQVKTRPILQTFVKSAGNALIPYDTLASTNVFTIKPVKYDPSSFLAP